MESVSEQVRLPTGIVPLSSALRFDADTSRRNQETEVAIERPMIDNSPHSEPHETTHDRVLHKSEIELDDLFSDEFWHDDDDWLALIGK